MGYEVLFSYNEKKDNGYDSENVKTLKKVVGKATEDTPLEHLAALIFRQFARRDVMVFDVEIYEYTKKRISFKENKDGILLKNKKFSFDLSTCDQTPETSSEEVFSDKEVRSLFLKNGFNRVAKSSHNLKGIEGKHSIYQINI
jgi:hypothetical protein